MINENNPWIRAQNQLKKVASRISLDPFLLARLLDPDRIIEVSLPLKKDNGEIVTTKGYRAQHNNLLGPYKGGITINPKDLSEQELERLTRLFTQRLSPVIGPQIDVPAPDVNTNPKIMS